MNRHTFVIPTNFMESGYVLSGTIAIRNAVEAVVLGIFGFFLCKLLPIPAGIDGISYYILIVLPLMMVGAYGVQGDPLSAFIIDLFKWNRRRKPCFYNAHGEAYTQEAAEYVLDSPQFRDILADALDKVKENFAAEDVAYVEGQTFRFAEDPEQEALKAAQEELRVKQEEALAKMLAEKKKPAPAPEQKLEAIRKPGVAKAVDAQQIAQKLVLENLDWEEDG